MIIAGFLSNILCEGKDFVATWFPGLPSLSHPGWNAVSVEWIKQCETFLIPSITQIVSVKFHKKILFEAPCSLE